MAGLLHPIAVLEYVSYPGGSHLGGVVLLFLLQAFSFQFQQVHLQPVLLDDLVGLLQLLLQRLYHYLLFFEHRLTQVAGLLPRLCLHLCHLLR